MRTGVVVCAKRGQQGFELAGGRPGLLPQPFLQRPHESFGNAIRLRPMPGNQHMHEVRIAGQLGERIGGKMRPAVGDQELEIRRQQPAQRIHHLVRGEGGTRREQGQLQALAGAVVGQDQDGDPLSAGGLRSQACPQVLALSPPGRVLGLPLPQGLLPLLADDAPEIRRERRGAAGILRGNGLRRGRILLVPQPPPQGVFGLALLPSGPPLDPQRIRLRTKRTAGGVESGASAAAGGTGGAIRGGEAATNTCMASA
jgi:hypothetical protein